MTTPPERIGVIAPMRIELQPLVDRLRLVPGAGEDVHRGQVGGTEVVAVLSRIGMAAAAAAAERLVDLGVDWVLVVGIAGGVGSSVAIGSLITPATVLDRASGAAYTPTTLPGVVAAGGLSCGDDLITDPVVLGAMAAQGVVAVDMETAAVAAVCEQIGCRWSVFRGISDDAGGGLVDDGLLGLTRPDGSADPAAVAAYLAADPARAEALARLADDTARATTVAADAAVAAIGALAGRGPS